VADFVIMCSLNKATQCEPLHLGYHRVAH